MTNRVFVVGHKNPDNDSICSAVGYAHLKNKIAKRDDPESLLEYIPTRLGPLPPESEWVLDTYGVEHPIAIKHVRSRVVDAMTPSPITIGPDATLMEAGRLLKKHNIRSLVVKDDDDKFLGLISTRHIAERYISATNMLEDNDPTSTMAVATNLIESLNQRVGDLMGENVLLLKEEDLIRDAAQDLIRSELREGVILDENNTAIGILTRSDIAENPKRKVILVDHNESRQAASGIEDAEVIEIVDHHRIADVSTNNPVMFLNLPWGSTATIVAAEFDRNKVKIPKDIAAVLLSAILTDTVVLKSPTTTSVDIERAKQLGKLIGKDPTDFGIELFNAKQGNEEFNAKKVVEADSKEFLVGDEVVLIAQHETVSLDNVLSHEEELRAHMNELRENHNYDFVLLLVTDIINEGSQFLLEGNPKTVNEAFGIKVNDKGGNWMPGILSRKKQVAARILS